MAKRTRARMIDSIDDPRHVVTHRGRESAPFFLGGFKALRSVIGKGCPLLGTATPSVGPGRYTEAMGARVRILAWLLFLPSGLALAQVPQADLVMTSLRDGEVITQTRTPTVTLTLTNRGSSPATGVVAVTPSSSPFPIGYVELTSPDGCVISVAGPPDAAILTWQVGTLAVDESRTCTLKFRARATAPDRALLFVLRASASELDPVPNNNIGGAQLALTALDIAVDVAMAASVQPASSLVPTDGTGRIYITLRNLGPERATEVRAGSEAFPSFLASFAQFEVFRVPEDPCLTHLDYEMLSQWISTGPEDGLAAGEAITCVIGIERRANATTAFYPLLLRSGPCCWGTYDTNPANNDLTLLLPLQLAPARVPSDSRLALSLLMFSMALAGCFALAKVLSARRP